MARANLAKHGISFEDAVTAFSDAFFLIFADPEQSSEENRFVWLAESSGGKLLVVSFTRRESHVRLISARKATRAERRFYEEEN
jgi:uncharacterized DUF497 family protein